MSPGNLPINGILKLDTKNKNTPKNVKINPVKIKNLAIKFI